MSELVSYRKFRPQKFANVLNQEHVKVTLANAVMNGRVGHAYLFTGPRGVGKTTLARIFARAINCPNMKEGEPCNECDICREFLGNNSLDLLEIDAASHTGVDNIRELIEHLQFAPTHAKRKVIIVDEVHMLSKGAFNALLKTLEEPPKHAVFILATTEIHKVPATVISRTQKFDFRKVGLSDLMILLRNVTEANQVQASDEALMSIAQAADGSGRDSLSLLDQVMSFAAGEITPELVEQVLGLTGLRTTAKYLELLISGNTKEAVNFISALLYQGRDLYQFQRDFLEYLRKLMLMQVGNGPGAEYTSDIREIMASQAKQLPLSRLVKLISLYQKAGNEVKYASIPSLPLEVASVEAVGLMGNVDSAPQPVNSNPQGEPSAKPSESNPELLNQVIASWQQILGKVKEYNHSLLSSLKLAVPAALEGVKLTVVFPYKFHKDAIDARKNRIIIDQVLEEVMGTKLVIQPVLQKDWSGPLPEMGQEILSQNIEIDAAPPEPPVTDSLNSALKIMGGEISDK
jgi:DNA polymerase III subunit gamma/tau